MEREIRRGMRMEQKTEVLWRGRSIGRGRTRGSDRDGWTEMERRRWQ